MTEANKALLRAFLDEVEATKVDYTPEFALTIVDLLSKREIARRVAQAAIDICNGNSDDLSEISHILETSNEEFKEEFKPVSDTLEEVIGGIENNTKWKFNLGSLRRQVDGIGPASFTIMAGRPEAGKTALWISFASAVGGWAWQGAKILAFCNEELAIRNKGRIFTASSGWTLPQIVANKEAFYDNYNKIAKNLLVYDVVGVDLPKIKSIIKAEEPDIVIVDQLDKVLINGEFNRGDERIKELYVNFREAGKEFNAAMIGISQLSAEAENRQFTDFSMLENSRTGKAAEADLIFCLGYNYVMGNNRTINIPKNKLTGKHEAVTVSINPELSRYTE